MALLKFVNENKLTKKGFEGLLAPLLGDAFLGLKKPPSLPEKEKSKRGMKERDKHVEKFHYLTRFIELIKNGFEHLAKIRGDADDQFRKPEPALTQLEPVSDELYNLLLNPGVLLLKD